MKVGRYTLEQDLKDLESAGCRVLAHCTCIKGHVILWHNKQGHTVTQRHRTGSSIGRALPFPEAMADFQKAIKELV